MPDMIGGQTERKGIPLIDQLVDGAMPILVPGAV